jgi:chemotaxis protein MotA
VYGGVFLDPIAPLLVFGGAAAVAALRSTREDCVAALKALGPCFTAKAELDARTARVSVNRICEKAEASGIATTDRAPLVERFLARAARELADARRPHSFAEWAEDDINAREDRHAAVHAVWRAMADAAPAMGMIGTVVGLIRMFASMDDPSSIGPGMALALTTTLYGIIVANLVAGPVAARLERLSRSEIDWQRKAAARLATLADRELAPAADERVTHIKTRMRTAA